MKKSVSVRASMKLSGMVEMNCASTSQLTVTSSWGRRLRVTRNSYEARNLRDGRRHRVSGDPGRVRDQHRRRRPRRAIAIDRDYNREVALDRSCDRIT